MRAFTLLAFNLVFALAAFLAWPIYEDSSFIVLVVAALVVANAIALLGLWRSWSALRVTLFTAAAYLVVGVPLAIPSALADPLAVLVGLGRLFVAPITAWKDLLTLSLPVGSYQTVLVPALLVFLVSAVASLSLGLRSKTYWMLGAVVALIPMLFAASFGSSAASASLIVLGWNFPAPLEVLLTLVTALVLVIWVALRRQSRPGQMTLVLAGSVVLALAMAPVLMTGATRDVLRVRIDPLLELQQQTSPLSVYRASFSNELFDTTLFTVSGGSEVDRIRIATLSGYNGQVATVDTTSVSADGDTFARIPELIETTGQATSGGDGAESVTMEIGALRGVWMPTTAQLTRISFDGERRNALTDGFFYNRALGAGIQLAEPGLVSGVQYSVQSAPADTAELAELMPGLTQPRIDQAYVPESLQDWLVQQRVGRTGAGLETLIERLRERGFLSHALTIDAANPPEWMRTLPGYSFQPSRAGHSSARIDQLFTQLRDREREVGSADEALLVAAPGDDEQFAVAAMLLADQLGFNARVVLGTKLTDSTQRGIPAIPACDQGNCAGGNLSAWLEVQGDSGEWVAVDVTPQFERPLAPNVDRLQDPQIVTEVQPPSIDAVQPPDTSPSESEGSDPEPEPAGVDLGWLWVTLTALGLSLLTLIVLLGPFLVVVAFKRLRARSRRRSVEPKDAILGGWNEFVDAEIDHGEALAPNLTRTELVARFAPESRARELATRADRAVFSALAPSADDAFAYWQLVDAQLADLKAKSSRRQRLRAALSLRSLIRWLWPSRVEQSVKRADGEKSA